MNGRSHVSAAVRRAFKGRTVLVTGHTGFKGAWLSEWLLLLGARVVGIALPPENEQSLFSVLHLHERVEHHVVDVRDADRLQRLLLATEPDYVFHLAAQSLVRASHVDPLGTISTNILGTTHVLEGLRALDRYYRGSQRACACVIVTSDKCYEQRVTGRPFQEDDRLAGSDPYSASKASVELIVRAYRESFFMRRPGITRVGVATVRAGNVIGGGDRATDRIMPDCVRSLERDKPIQMRNPGAIRPWQHVLDPLAGYLMLGARLQDAITSDSVEDVRRFSSPFNFGPHEDGHRPVSDLVETVLDIWWSRWEPANDSDDLHEDQCLRIDSDKARRYLGWQPRWDFNEAVRRTVSWYRAHVLEGADAGQLTRRDIGAYET